MHDRLACNLDEQCDATTRLQSIFALVSGNDHCCWMGHLRGIAEAYRTATEKGKLTAVAERIRIAYSHELRDLAAILA